MYPLLVKPLTFVMDPIIGGRIVSILSGFVAMLVLTLLAGRLYGAGSARMMAWAYASSPLFLWCNLRVLTESTFQLFFCLSIYLLLIALRQRQQWAAPAFYFVSGLAALTRPEGFVLLPLVILHFFS